MSFNNEVNHISLHTAEEFLNAISPRSKYLEGGLQRYSHYFIFRGHADDHWQLIPKALRFGELLEVPLSGWGRVRRIEVNNSGRSAEQFFAEGQSSGQDWNGQHQVASEWNMLKMFFHVADRNGLQQLRAAIEKSLIRDLSQIDIENWPRTEFLSLLALA